ncbi:GNAT family N-acetyltransferase [Cellulomonas sp. 179-A 4D5 NHS]|uniref:GNAT family N-acetyltransferase n=1 Tax=Cellulomonas sp. 179-A 4D5 NHS TaxID=3142378 RepID=UPI0039A1C559
MSARVRRAVPGDADALAALAAITFPLACPPGSSRESQQAFIAQVLSPERFAEYLADPARTLLVAHDDAVPQPVGYTMLVEGEPADADVRAAVRLHPTVELSKCYVLPGHHGQGVATLLMAATLDAARRTGAAGVWLGVNQQNLRAQAFYRRAGFEVVGTKRFLVGDRLEDDFVLERVLRGEVATGTADG